MYFRIKVIFILLVCLSICGFAQRPNPNSKQDEQGLEQSIFGIISGIIIDSQSKKPVEYATIALVSIGDSTKLYGALADESGKFAINQLTFGKYILKTSFIGYSKYISDTIYISPNNKLVQLPTISISPDSKLLDDIVVSGERQDMLINIDKKIFEVDKNSVVTGGSAADVLKQIPSINIDLDGNIQMRGSGNLIVWINGKPSGMTGSSRQAVLDQIPASSIEKVEMITNPSAKYDPDGMSGIINIILKKNRADGINGSASFGLGTRDKYNASNQYDIYNSIQKYNTFNKYNGALSLNVKTGKINISTSYGYRDSPSWQVGKNLRENKFGINSNTINQYNGEDNQNKSHNLNLNVDYESNKKNTFGIGLLGGYNHSINNELLWYLFKNENFVNITNRKRTTTGNGDSYNIDANFYWRKIFDNPQKELNFSGSISQSENYGFRNFNNLDFIPFDPSIVNGNTISNTTTLFTDNSTRNINYGSSQIFVLQLDYSNPIGTKSKLETGAKSTLRNFENKLIFDTLNTNNERILNNFLSNNSAFTENVNAVYGILQHTINEKWATQAGVRVEQTIVNAQVANSNIPYNYFRIFPSVFLLRRIGSDQEIKASFSQRINRPGFEAINPIPSYTDPYNLRVGNPAIRPEDIYSFEIAYGKNWKLHTFTSSIYYRITDKPISRVRIIDSITRVSSIIFANLGYSENYGAEVVLKNQLFPWWNITSSLNVYGNKISGYFVEPNGNSQVLFNENLAANGRIMSNFKFWKGADLQITANYMTPVATPQGTFQGFNGVDIGFKKDIIKNKAFITINLSDVFDTRQFQVEFNTQNMSSTLLRKRETRVLTFNFTYKFGKEINSTIKRGKKPEINPEGNGGGG